MVKQKILCVGVCTLDIVQVCATFPTEDSDKRSLEAYWQRGGNASNNCSVLSQLGADCELLSTFGDPGSAQTRFLLDDLEKFRISTKHCIHHANCQSPMSTVILAEDTGSRTILHNNPNLPGLTFQDFKNIQVSDYRWIHFEGFHRNVSVVKEMLEHISTQNSLLEQQDNRVIISVDVEKPRQQLLELIPLADVVFVSKDFAKYRGCNTMLEAVTFIRKFAKTKSIVICPWGELGAAAQEDDGEIVTSPAFPPDLVTDTLGAGDTFCASVIYALTNKKSVQESLIFGCQIAGAKVGMKGFNGINKVHEAIK